jgi:hypothetical protein
VGRHVRELDRLEQTDWRAYELTDDLKARVQQTNEEHRRHSAEERRRVAQQIADDPEGPFKEYNAAMRSLRSQAPTMSHSEVKTRMRDLGREHDVSRFAPDADARALTGCSYGIAIIRRDFRLACERQDHGGQSDQ